MFGSRTFPPEALPSAYLSVEHWPSDSDAEHFEDLLHVAVTRESYFGNVFVLKNVPGLVRQRFKAITAARIGAEVEHKIHEVASLCRSKAQLNVSRSCPIDIKPNDCVARLAPFNSLSEPGVTKLSVAMV
mmetsp:Transcript_30631/g.84489  ORF Transcript_30631/g.84489 Transcript_30631/m.84489 type:complete len:130 (-) Transcript_30631:78-467(-)